jgi:hypothetical protein
MFYTTSAISGPLYIYMLTLTNTDFYKNVGPVSNPTLTLVCPYIILRNVLYVQFL